MPGFLSRLSIFSRGLTSLTTSEASAQYPFKILVPKISILQDKKDNINYQSLLTHLRNKQMDPLPNSLDSDFFTSRFTSKAVRGHKQDWLLNVAEGIVVYLSNEINITDGVKIGYLLKWCENVSQYRLQFEDHPASRDNYSGKIPFMLVTPGPIANTKLMTELAAFIDSSISSCIFYRNPNDLNNTLQIFKENMNAARAAGNNKQENVSSKMRFEF